MAHIFGFLNFFRYFSISIQNRFAEYDKSQIYIVEPQIIDEQFAKKLEYVWSEK